LRQSSAASASARSPACLRSAAFTTRATKKPRTVCPGTPAKSPGTSIPEPSIMMRKRGISTSGSLVFGALAGRDEEHARLDADARRVPGAARNDHVVARLCEMRDAFAALFVEHHLRFAGEEHHQLVALRMYFPARPALAELVHRDQHVALEPAEALIDLLVNRGRHENGRDGERGRENGEGFGEIRHGQLPASGIR